jgi:phage tail-like protein
MSNPNALTTQIDGSVGFVFQLELHGQPVKGVTEVSGLAMENTPVDQKVIDAKGQPFQQKIPGRGVSPGTVSVKLATVPGNNIEKDFFAAVKTHKPPKVGDAAITLYDTADKPVLRWALGDAWVKDLAWGNLSTSEAQAMTLDVTIQYNTIKLT